MTHQFRRDPLNSVRVRVLPDDDPIFEHVAALTLVHRRDIATVYVRASEWKMLKPELEAIGGTWKESMQ